MSPRRRALAYGVIAEILLAAMLIVWSSGTDTTQTAPFGLELSRAAVLAAMVILAVAMVVLSVARRLPPLVTGVVVVLAVLLNGAVGAMAVGMLVTDPGLAFTLGLGCLLAFAVAWRIAIVEIGRN